MKKNTSYFVLLMVLSSIGFAEVCQGAFKVSPAHFVIFPLEEKINELISVYKEGLISQEDLFGFILKKMKNNEMNFKETLGLMLKLRFHDITPTLEVYHGAMEVAYKAQRVIIVFTLFRELKEEGLSPNIITYTYLIEAALLQDQDEIAIDLVRQLKENGLKPNSVIYEIFINYFLKKDQPDEAFELFHEMKENGISPSLEIYQNFIRYYFNNFKLDMAWKFYLKMSKNCLHWRPQGPGLIDLKKK